MNLEDQRDKRNLEPEDDKLSQRPAWQYAAITAVLFFFTLLYGYLQELVCIHLFARQFGLFLTLVQFVGYMGFASLQRLHKGEARRHKLPLAYCVALALGQAAMQCLSNMAMRYLNYPAKVLFKSCRVLPTMIYGVVVYNKKYSRRDWVAMVLLVCGLVVFMRADIKTSPSLHPLGIALISGSLLLDAAILNLQDHCFAHFGSDEDEVVFVSYAGGSAVLLAACVGSGELETALAFMDSHFAGSPAFAGFSLLSFATCGYFGVVCVTALTRRFGPLVAALTTTVRKALTLVLSFVLFPKPVVPGHWVGALFFLAGIGLKAAAARRSHALGGGDGSLGGLAGRKDSSSEADHAGDFAGAGAAEEDEEEAAQKPLLVLEAETPGLFRDQRREEYPGQTSAAQPTYSFPWAEGTRASTSGGNSQAHHSQSIGIVKADGSPRNQPHLR